MTPAEHASQLPIRTNKLRSLTLWVASFQEEGHNFGVIEDYCIIYWGKSGSRVNFNLRGKSGLRRAGCWVVQTNGFPYFAFF